MRPSKLAVKLHSAAGGVNGKGRGGKKEGYCNSKPLSLLTRFTRKVGGVSSLRRPYPIPQSNTSSSSFDPDPAAADRQTDGQGGAGGGMKEGREKGDRRLCARLELQNTPRPFQLLTLPFSFAKTLFVAFKSYEQNAVPRNLGKRFVPSSASTFLAIWWRSDRCRRQ